MTSIRPSNVSFEIFEGNDIGIEANEATEELLGAVIATVGTCRTIAGSDDKFDTCVNKTGLTSTVKSMSQSNGHRWTNKLNFSVRKFKK